MQKVPAGHVTVKGLDVSHYDETIDFKAVKAAGFDFVYAKCTEGLSVVDGNYLNNRAKARAAGLLFGAYHFFRPTLDATKQAEFYLAHAKLENGDLLPMLDWEVSQSKTKDPVAAKVWLGLIERACGKKAIIYGPPYMLNDFKLDISFKDHALFVAHYGTTAPLVPSPWEVWSYWQFTEKGSVPGIPAPDEDMDLWNGPHDALAKMII